MGALLLLGITVAAVWWVASGRFLRWLDTRTGGSIDDQVRENLPWLLGEVARELRREHL